MPTIDYLKELIAYLKLWLSVVAVTNISLIGWLISTFAARELAMVVLALGGVILLSSIVVVLHGQIEQGIQQIGRL